MSFTEKEIRVSAPGKVILHGEHVVVYGKAAMAASLNLRCHLVVKTLTEPDIIVDLPDVDVHRQFSVTSIQNNVQTLIGKTGSIHDPVPATDEIIAGLKKYLGLETDSTETRLLALAAFLYIYGSIFRDASSLPAISISMKSELPVGAGLGSSAAFSVSLVTALLQLGGHINSEKLEDGSISWRAADKDIINKWAFIGEKVIHGRPSGIDNSVSTYGGALKFQKGEITHIEKMPTLSVMLINTKVPRSTMVLVAGVRQKYNTYQDIFDSLFNAVEAITERAQEVYKQLCDKETPEDYKTLGDLMDLNHQMLNMMGVGHPTLDQIVSVAKKHGLSAKLTGAGGGGCAFVLIPPGTEVSSLEAVKSEVEELGFTTWMKTSVGGHGVLREL